MPSPLNSSQAQEVSYLDGLDPYGTVTATSFYTWEGGGNETHKWYNNGSGTPLASSSGAGTGGGVVTYAYDPARPPTAQQQQAFVAALTLWSDEANITFAPAASTSSADVWFGASTTGGTDEQNAYQVSATLGSRNLPVPNAANGRAEVFFNTNGSYGTIGSFTAQGGYGVSAMVHEVGHLMGLGHAGPYNGSVNPGVDQFGPYDSRLWSIMSYIWPDDPTAKYYPSYPVNANWQIAGSPYEAAPETPMMLDIQAVQQLYGAPVHTALSGGQVFGFNCNISDASRSFFDFSQNPTPVVTIWDAGTGNKLDLTGYSAANVVNLNPGTFSSVGGLTNNLGIAYGTAIDAAAGGSGNDTFILNGDNDGIDGGGGVNTVVFAGAHTQYTLISAGQFKVFKNNATGVTDTLTNVQTLSFGDETVQLTTPAVYDSPNPLFDPDYYLLTNPDVAAAGVDPYQHYLTTGWKEGRNPSALFNDQYYLNQNPDVAASGTNPLLHYEASGWREGRDPSILFSTNAYLGHNPDIAQAGLDPLVHYVTYGAVEGRANYAAQPHATGPQDPLVADAFIYGLRPDVAAAGIDPTTWFYATGWLEGTNPDPLFNIAYYLQQNPDVAAAHVDPLTQYEQYGWREGRNPSAAFSTNAYLAHNPDVAASGIDPLVHYLQYGQAEGRAIYPV